MTTKDIRKRQGDSYARIGPRKTIGRATGLSATTLHRRCEGKTKSIALDELLKIERSGLNARHVPVEAIAVLDEAAVQGIPATQLAVDICELTHTETEQDGAEDQTQARAHAAALAVVIMGADNVPLPRRLEIARTLRQDADEVLAYIPILYQRAAKNRALADRLTEAG